MSTEKSLIKHLKSNDEFLVANVSNFFEKHSGQDSSSYIQHTFQATRVSRRTVFREGKEFEKPVHFRRRNVRNGDNTNLWTTLMMLLSETMCRSFTSTAISFRP